MINPHELDGYCQLGLNEQRQRAAMHDLADIARAGRPARRPIVAQLFGWLAGQRGATSEDAKRTSTLSQRHETAY
jgi:hypothetical protein